jgi:hypothetical protein
MDIYFISSQTDSSRVVELSLRSSGRVPELWNAVKANTEEAKEWKIVSGRTILPVLLPANGSIFIVLGKATVLTQSKKGKNWITPVTIKTLDPLWNVQFDSSLGGPSKTVSFNALTDWSKSADTLIKYYSGSAVYSQSFEWKENSENTKHTWLDLGTIANIAAVKLNEIDCGVVWTAPYRADISKALKPGINQLQIEVTNTWANRLIGDQRLPVEKRITNTTAPVRIGINDLKPAGLLGPVSILAGQ